MLLFFSVVLVSGRSFTELLDWDAGLGWLVRPVWTLMNKSGDREKIRWLHISVYTGLPLPWRPPKSRSVVPLTLAAFGLYTNLPNDVSTSSSGCVYTSWLVKIIILECQPSSSSSSWPLFYILTFPPATFDGKPARMGCCDECRWDALSGLFLFFLDEKEDKHTEKEREREENIVISVVIEERKATIKD